MAGSWSPSDPSPEVGNASRDEASLVCDVCGAPAVDRRCKVICLRCGYTRDCSDP